MTLIVLSALFSGGLLARHIQQQMNPIPLDAYAETDREFFERSGRSLGDAGAVEPLSGAPPAVPPLPADTSLLADSSHDVVVYSAAPDPPRPDHASPGNAANAEIAIKSSAERRIDINRASSDELQQLPRIGPKTAERIIAFRETYGPFGHADDLVQVRGIGPKTLEQLRPLIYVGQSSIPR